MLPLPEPALEEWRCAVSRLGKLKRKTWRRWNPKYNVGRRERYAARKATEARK